MALNLSRRVKCAKCDQPYTRTHGKQKYCNNCRPRWVTAQSAARAATKPARLEANRKTRKKQLPPKMRKIRDGLRTGILAQPCPHKLPLGDCQDSWCRNRAEDLQAHGYSVNTLQRAVLPRDMEPPRQPGGNG